MKKLSFIFTFHIIFLFFLLINNSFSQEANPCIACHANLKEAKFIHNPLAMGCEACHKSMPGKNHPEKGSIILVQTMPGLCYNCHDETKLKGKTIHSPVSKGMCTGCHNPHSSNNENLLKFTNKELCFSCHDKNKFEKKYTHKVINVIGCSTCHNPHASNNPSLLPNPINDLCTTCHKAQSSGIHIVALPGGKIHPIKDIKDISTLKIIKVPDPVNPKRQIEMPDPKVPGKDLSCVSCHNPHSSDYSKLFPVQRICLKCHKY